MLINELEYQIENSDNKFDDEIFFKLDLAKTDFLQTNTLSNNIDSYEVRIASFLSYHIYRLIWLFY